MNFTETTLSVLQNFNAITLMGIVFDGDTLIVHNGSGIGSAAQQGKTLVAKAVLTQTFEDGFAISDGVQLFSALKSFNKPELNVEGNTIVITDVNDNRMGEYRLRAASPQVVSKPEDITTKLPTEGLITLEMTAESYTRLFRGLAIVGTPSIIFEGSGGDLLISAYDANNPSANKYTMSVGTTTEEFRIIVDIESIGKLMKGVDYQVSLSRNGFIKFDCDYEGVKMTYLVAAQA